MAQAMEKGRVIELLEYYKDIDGEVSIYRKIISDLTDKYYNPIGAIQCDGLPKGKIIYHDKQKIWRLIFQIMSAAKSESMKQRCSSCKH